MSTQHPDITQALLAIGRIRDLLNRYETALTAGGRIEPRSHGGPAYRRALTITETYLAQGFNPELSGVAISAPVPESTPKAPTASPAEQLVTDEGAMLIRRAEQRRSAS